MSNKPKGCVTKPAKEAPSEALMQIEGLPPEMAEVIESLPAPQQKIIIQSMLAIQQESFSGPIPHPAILEGYEKIQAGFAERIVKMAEKEQDHRFECDDKIIKGSISTTKRGQWMGYTIALVFGIISLVLGLMGQVAVASIIGGLDLVALVTVFVKSQSSPKAKKEND